MNSTEKRLPDFIIIGAAKAGTSSLYAYLSWHPQIFMSPVKETNFFAYQGRNTKNFIGNRAKASFPVKTIDEYHRQFLHANERQILGEASPIYLESPIAAERIRSLLPNAKIIVSLRNPVERAFSGYIMAVRNGIQKPIEIEKAFDYSSHHVQASLYYEKLYRYFKVFPRKQIKVCLFDDLCHDNLAVLKDIFKFIGANTDFQPDVSVKFNVTKGYPKRYFVSKLLWGLRKISKNNFISRITPIKVRNLGNWAMKKNLGPNIEIPISVRDKLNNFYFEDIVKVQSLLKKDLGIWLNA